VLHVIFVFGTATFFQYEIDLAMLALAAGLGFTAWKAASHKPCPAPPEAMRHCGGSRTSHLATFLASPASYGHMAPWSVPVGHPQVPLWSSPSTPIVAKKRSVLAGGVAGSETDRFQRAKCTSNKM
jgi:hypothetical protein